MRRYNDFSTDTSLRWVAGYNNAYKRMSRRLLEKIVSLAAKALAAGYFVEIQKAYQPPPSTIHCSVMTGIPNPTLHNEGRAVTFRARNR
jgi:hypothetical protein